MHFNVVDLGRIRYEPCVDYQRELLEDVAAGRTPSTLLFVEHPPVFTLGASFHEENLLFSRADLEQRGFEVVPTDRGGDVTYHGDGQLVIYPIFSLAERGKDLHRWLRDLEETILLTLREFGLEGRRFPPHTGAWIDDRKVAAIGIKVRKWVSMHGISLNCDVDLGPFQMVIPCGIKGYGVTSISQELGRKVTVAEVRPVVEAAFRRLF